MTGEADVKAWIAATVRRGGFSSERAYEVRGIGGSRASGTANELYVFTEDGRQLPEPAQGVPVHALIECRVTGMVNAIAGIELPCVHPESSGPHLKVYICDLRKPITLTATAAGEAEKGEA